MATVGSDVREQPGAGRRPEVRIVGFVCDWAVGLAGLANADGTLRAHPTVHVIAVPCSGFLRPAWLEAALRAGADGAFVVGCPMGDCVNREGNFLIRDRIAQLSRRLSRQRIDPARLAMLAYGLHDREEFLAGVGEFVERVRRLPPRETPAPKGGPGRA